VSTDKITCTEYHNHCTVALQKELSIGLRRVADLEHEMTTPLRYATSREIAYVLMIYGLHRRTSLTEAERTNIQRLRSKQKDLDMSKVNLQKGLQDHE
jgi:hypothetical protein